MIFSADDGCDVGVDTGSPVSPDYYDKAPFKFNGRIDQFTVKDRPFPKPAEAAAPSRAATSGSRRALGGRPAALRWRAPTPTAVPPPAGQ